MPISAGSLPSGLVMDFQQILTTFAGEMGHSPQFIGAYGAFPTHLSVREC
jgi:hypothetical protein